MDIERLKSLGFELSVGQVDYRGRTYGTFNQHGAMLTDAGRELVDQLLAKTPAESEGAPTSRKPPRRKANPDAEPVASLVDGLFTDEE